MVNLRNERKTMLFMLFLLLTTITATAQTNHYAFNRAMDQSPDEAGPFAIANEGAETIRILQSERIAINTITKDYIYFTSTPRKMAALKKTGKIRDFHFELSHPVLFNDSTREKHFVNQVHAGTNGLDMPYTGAGVLIGVIDDLLDYNHPDFKDANGKTRVMYLWDQTFSTDAARIPAPYGYGQEFDSTDLNVGVPAITQANNHGTTVTGAAAGGGRANGHNKGMAPDANIIFVRSNFGANNWTLTVADAVDFIFKKADLLGMPCVINISAGSYLGSHDGTDPATQKINALLDAKAGRILVVSAGNAGHKGTIHAHGVVDADTSFIWMNGNPNKDGYGKWTMFFDLWGGVDDVENINFAFGANANSGSYQSLGKTIYRNVATSFTPNFKDTIFDAGNKPMVALDVYAGVQNMVYEMYVIMQMLDTVTPYHMSFLTTGSGVYDMWTWAEYGVAGSYVFESNIPDAATYPPIVNYHAPDTLQTIGSDWICSTHAITVGNIQNRINYVDLNGNTQFFATEFSPSGKRALTSSMGPTRDNRMKPDVSAAGDGSISPGNLIFMSIPGLESFIDSSGWFVRNGGTSMASPVVAGIAALYLQKCPGATWQDFRDELYLTSYTDGFTGTVPNYAYGHGKVHALNLMLNNLRPQLNFVLSDTLCFDNPVLTLTATPSGGVFSGSGVTGSSFNPFGLSNTNVAITYNYTDTYGCFNESASQTVFIDPSCNYVGLNELSEQLQINVYPNPTEQIITIDGAAPDAVFELYDIQGKKVAFKLLPGQVLDFNGLSSGIYELKISQSNGVANIKIRLL